MTEDTKKEIQREEPRNKEYEQPQSFDKVGLLEVRGGDVVLRARNGERDHLYPLHRAVDRYEALIRTMYALLRNGVRGWDTLKDICEDMRAKILEAIEYRRSHNIPCDEPIVLAFYERETNKSFKKSLDEADGVEAARRLQAKVKTTEDGSLTLE